MKLTKSEGGAVFRKIAMGSWNTAADPSVYGLLEIDMTNALAYLDSINKNSEIKVGVSELVGRASALVLKQRPEMNGLIKWGRIYLRDSVNLFYQVNVAGTDGDKVGKANLLGLTIPDAETKSIFEISKELKQKAYAIKTGQENDVTKSSKKLALVPWQLMKLVLNFTSFLMFELNFPVQYLGLPKDPFGSADKEN